MSFAPVVVNMASTIMGGSKGALKIVGRDPIEHDGHLAGMANVIHSTLLPGKNLDALNQRTVQLVTAAMDALASNTEGIYGPQNPFREDYAPSLCPGRHFAATEIVAFAALFILRFDSRPASGARWLVPPVEKTNLATSIHQPDENVEIEVRLLDDGRGKWEVKVYGSNEPMEVSAEDIATTEVGT